MKKIILAVFLIFIFGGGAWYAQTFVKNLGDKDSPSSLPTSDFVPSEEQKAYEAEAKLLQAEAVRLARRPFISVGGMSQESLARAKEKINNAVNLIEANYDYDAPWLELGAYRRMIGDNDGALEAWQFLSKIRPFAHVSYHNIGDLYAFTIRDYEQGEKYLLKSILVGPGNIQGYLALANLYSVPEFGKQSEVPKILLKGIDNNPEFPDLYAVLGSYYRDHNDIANAIKYFEKALLLNPDNASVRNEINSLKE